MNIDSTSVEKYHLRTAGCRKTSNTSAATRCPTRIVRATRNPTATTSRSPPRPPNNHAILPRIIARI